MSKMDPKIKALWVEALRSGDYRQGRDRLCSNTPNGHRFCCLGVLVDLAVKDGVGQWTTRPTSPGTRSWIPNDSSAPGNGEAATREDVYLPEAVIRWAFPDASPHSGFERPTVKYGDPETDIHLTDLNDIHKLDFGSIADRIERSL